MNFFDYEVSKHRELGKDEALIRIHDITRTYCSIRMTGNLNKEL